MPRVLLLGSTGLLGTEFANLLASSTFDVVAPTRSELDLASEKDLLSFLRNDFNYDYVINCSGYNFVDRAEESKDEETSCLWYNAQIPRIIGAFFEDTNSKCRIIQFSSDYVFDGKKGEEYLENDIKNPLSVYGKSKSMGEDYLLRSNKNAVVIRTSWLFGRAKQNFISKIYDKALAGETLNIVSDQLGKPTYTVDLARHVVENLDVLNNGIYHLSNETVFSWYDFAKFALGLSKNKFKINPIDASDLMLLAERPRFSALKNTKLPLMRTGLDAITDYVNMNIL